MEPGILTAELYTLAEILESAAEGLPLSATAKLTQAKLLCQLLSYCLFFPPNCNYVSSMEICFVTTFGRCRYEGVRGFYKGFVPSVLR